MVVVCAVLIIDLKYAKAINTMKKQRLFLFAALLPLLVNAQIRVEIEGIWYNLTPYTKHAEVTNWTGTRYSGAITIPATITYYFEAYSVTAIGDEAFYDCYSLTSIILPEGVTSIGNSAFARCRSLTSITLPEEDVTSIGEYAFYDCRNLTTIVLPKSVNDIGSKAYAGCSELTDVYCYTESVPHTNASAFDGSFIEYATLHVPANAINSYKATAPWSSFGSIVTIEDVTLEQCTTPTISYLDGKVVFSCATEGATIKSSIKENISGEYSDIEVTFIPTYTITAYATKEGYEDSDEVSLTLCWIPCTEEHESEEDGILKIPSKPVLIQSQGGMIILSGLADGTEVAAYDLAGRELATGIASNGTAELATGLEVGNTAIVKIDNNSIKIVVK